MFPQVHAAFSRWVVYEFRANGGKLANPFAGGNLILLTTLPVATGLHRTVPVSVLPHSGALVAAAGGAGEDDYPGWYQDLLALPRAVVETGRETYEVAAAQVTDEAERRDLLRLMAVDAGPAPPSTSAMVRLLRARRADDSSQSWTRRDEFLRGHDRFRRQLAQVRAELHGMFAFSGAPPDPVGRLRAYSNCRRFCRELYTHLDTGHAALDAAIERWSPQSGAALATLRQRREGTARTLAELQQSLDTPGACDDTRVCQQADRLGYALDRQFSYEAWWVHSL